MFKKMLEKISGLKAKGVEKAKIDVLELEEFVNEVKTKFETLSQELVKTVQENQKPVKEIEEIMVKPGKEAIQREECCPCGGTGFEKISGPPYFREQEASSGEICKYCKGLGYNEYPHDITPDTIKIAGPIISIFRYGKVLAMFNVMEIQVAKVMSIKLLASEDKQFMEFWHRTISVVINGDNSGFAMGHIYTKETEIRVEPEEWFKVVSKAWKNISKRKK